MAEGRPSTAPVLATDRLTRRFGGLIAVREVSIALHHGELHAVIGPNGAGKTTLVNMLSGELRPTAGAIAFAGRDVAGEPAWRMARLGIARSFQRTDILGSLSVLENVRLAVQAVAGASHHPLRLATRARELVDRAQMALARCGLEAVAGREAGALAHGEQRQLEVAMALAGKPKVVLLDEPLAGMGPEETQRMTGLLLELRRDHAILLIEHDMDVVFAVADWVTVMVEGGVLAEGRPAAVRANAVVRAAYLGGDS
jgi:branched-chain amino acid transport system ATP-binding protein